MGGDGLRGDAPSAVASSVPPDAVGNASAVDTDSVSIAAMPGAPAEDRPTIVGTPGRAGSSATVAMRWGDRTY